MPDIQELRDAFSAARRARWAAERARDDRWTELQVQLHELEKRLSEQLREEHGSIVDAALEAEREAQVALDRAKEESALQNAASAIGMVMVEWDKNQYSHTWHQTGKRGVVEVFTRETQGQRRGWGYVEPGSLIIRYLNKDGKPGSRYRAFEQDSRWLPEGVDKNAAPAEVE
jgi:hypothetical protein